MESGGALVGQINHITKQFEGEFSLEKKKIEAPPPCTDSDDSSGGYLNPEDSEVSSEEEYDSDDDFPCDIFGVKPVEVVINEEKYKEFYLPCIQFAIEENNKIEGTNYELVELLKVHFSVGGDISYFFTMKVKNKDGNDHKPFICRAAVYDSFTGERMLGKFFRDAMADAIYLQKEEAHLAGACSSVSGENKVC